MLLAVAAGCDQGPYSNASTGEGPPIEVVAKPVLVTVPSTPTSTQPSTQIQLAFDRLLMPDSVIRQAFVLEDGSGQPLSSPATSIAYDPYTRVVTITPPAPVLEAGQNYRLFIASPMGPKDPNGLRAIDGAPIDPTIAQPFVVPVPSTIPSAPALPVVDYCADVQSISQHCAGSDCHTGMTPPPASGLLLDTAANLQATAMNRIAIGSNTGPSLGSNNVPVVTTFGIDMPIIDQNGADPSNSWLMYKILMADPNVTSPAPANNYAVAWQPLTDDERARLANLVPGREMPYPANPSAALDDPERPSLPDAFYETLSLWIAQGAPLADCTP